MAGCTATPCEQCPWRVTNHGKRHRRGFYTARNRQRLWNQIRGGGGVQSCHLTDPSHPDHIEAGANPDRLREETKECMGSVVLVVRELKHLEAVSGGKEVTSEGIDAYLADKDRRGLKRDGLLYYILARIAYAGLPGGAPALPNPPDELLAADWIGR